MQSSPFNDLITHPYLNPLAVSPDLSAHLNDRMEDFSSLLLPRPKHAKEQGHSHQATCMSAAAPPGWEWALVRVDSQENPYRPNNSTASVHTVHYRSAVQSLSLKALCGLIDDHPSLKSATIVTTSCYSQFTVGVKHRFVVLEVARPGRKKLWLRLDRRTDRLTGLIQFALNLGETPANDVVRSRIRTTCTFCVLSKWS